MSDLNDDITRYRKGELSPEQMHDLERRALSDPFLSDALDGAGTLRQDEFAADVDALQRELDRKTRRPVTLWIWAGRIAAGVAVLALATLILWNPDSPEKLASNHHEKDVAANDSTDANHHRDLSLAEREPFTPRLPRRKPSPTEELVAEAEVEIPSDLFSDEDFLLPEVVAPPAKPKTVVKGFVVDAEEGRGLPGVNVTIKGTNIGTITDEEGNYQIQMDSLNSGLVFSYIGYETREIRPSTPTSVDVAMEPDVSELSEIVVVGYGAREPGTAVEPVTVEMAEPAGGRRAYKQYLEQSLRYPQQALNNKIEGKVTVQFMLESNGSISDFKVIKSLGHGCDEEVIRLIKEGPKWYPTKRNHEPVRDKVKVRMKFSLPKKK